MAGRCGNNAGLMSAISVKLAVPAIVPR